MLFALYTGAIVILSAIIYYFLIFFIEFKLFWAILLIILGISIPILFLIINKKLANEKKSIM